MQQFYPQPPGHDFQYELHKDMNFAAAHFIPNGKAGKCHTMHGHTYWVDVTIAGDELNDIGMLVNFADVKDLIHGRYDHNVLNSFPEYTGDHTEPHLMPTTEVVAQNIYEIVENHLHKETTNKPTCLQVLVRETPTSYVLYRPTKEYVRFRKEEPSNA